MNYAGNSSEKLSAETTMALFDQGNHKNNINYLLKPLKLQVQKK